MTTSITDTKRTARQAWLTIALGVADGLPAPQRLYLEADDERIELDPADPPDGQRWADWLDPDAHRIVVPSGDGSKRYHTWQATRGGWAYSIHSWEAVDEPDEAAKARLAEALNPDAPQIESHR